MLNFMLHSLQPSHGGVNFILAQLYVGVYNLHRLTTLEGVMEQSLTKTLAAKQKLSVPKILLGFIVVTIGVREQSITTS